MRQGADETLICYCVVCKSVGIASPFGKHEWMIGLHTHKQQSAEDCSAPSLLHPLADAPLMQQDAAKCQGKDLGLQSQLVIAPACAIVYLQCHRSFSTCRVL